MDDSSLSFRSIKFFGVKSLLRYLPNLNNCCLLETYQAPMWGENKFLKIRFHLYSCGVYYTLGIQQKKLCPYNFKRKQRFKKTQQIVFYQNAIGRIFSHIMKVIASFLTGGIFYLLSFLSLTTQDHFCLILGMEYSLDSNQTIGYTSIDLLAIIKLSIKTRNGCLRV